MSKLEKGPSVLLSAALLLLMLLSVEAGIISNKRNGGVATATGRGACLSNGWGCPINGKSSCCNICNEVKMKCENYVPGKKALRSNPPVPSSTSNKNWKVQKYG